MADTKASALSNQTAPDGNDLIYVVDNVNSASKNLKLSQTSFHYRNFSTTSQGAGFAADTYLTGSNIPMPASGPVAGTQYHLRFRASKTAAGTATPAINVRFGTGGTTSDTSLINFTFGAGTAVIDVGTFELWVVFTAVGSGTSAVAYGSCDITTNLTTTGISNANKNSTVASSGFNSTTSGAILGASLNGGTSAAWTVTNVFAELIL